jgi:DNA-binding transcriptional LysR family regulator
MRFQLHNNLRTFTLVARHQSFASAAEELNLTKGAVSHQIRLLEQALGFKVFIRLPRGIKLEPKGRELLAAAQTAYQDLEQTIESLRQSKTRTLTIGLTTYLASRWLSPRLMNFMRMEPDIRLRIQPMIDLMNLKGEGVDLAIRWGNGSWSDVAIERLFGCPAWPSGNAAALDKVQQVGLAQAFEEFTLLHDREDSNAWSQWYDKAKLPYQARADTLIIPDPNVRVQAVIDGQGVALNDDLIEAEIAAGKLFRLSDVDLADYGYFLAFPPAAMANSDIVVLSDWLKDVAREN